MSDSKVSKPLNKDVLNMIRYERPYVMDLINLFELHAQGGMNDVQYLAALERFREEAVTAHSMRKPEPEPMPEPKTPRETYYRVIMDLQADYLKMFPDVQSLSDVLKTMFGVTDVRLLTIRQVAHFAQHLQDALKASAS